MVLGLTPVPASRPRVTKWGSFYPATYTKWTAAAKDILAVKGDKLEGAIALYVEHVIPRPKTSKLGAPHPDIDNLTKAPMDLLTKDGRVWDDDKQVVLLVALKRFADPGEEHGTTMHAIPMGTPT